MLKIQNVSKNFGGIQAVNNTSLKIEKSSITGLIGPNGAGKTTLFNTIAGVYMPSNGKIFLEEEDITNLKPHELFDKSYDLSKQFFDLDQSIKNSYSFIVITIIYLNYAF